MAGSSSEPDDVARGRGPRDDPAGRVEKRLIKRPDEQRFGTADPTSRRDEVKRESHDVTGFPGAPFMTRSMGRGLVIGTVIGGVLGALVFAPLGFISVAGLELHWRLLIAAGIGAVGGSTAGALYLGGRLPEVEGEMHDPEGRPTIASSERNRPESGGLV